MKMTSFQLIVLALFGFFLVAGVGVFAIYGGNRNSSSNVGPVTLWGTVDDTIMEPLIGSLRQQEPTLQNLTYVQKKPTTYKAELINALASGNGPDLFMVTQGDVASFSDKLTVITYGTLSQASFENAFIDEAQLFETPEGTLALPFLVDPLVMYWNKGLFATAGFAQPPKYWKEFLTLGPKITSIDNGSTVHRSAIALGEWNNVAHAKDILSILMIQAGDSITKRREDGVLQSTLGNNAAGGVSNQAESALMFFSEFADPAKTTYSWNRSLPNSRDAFAAGDLAVYLGLASEYKGLRTANPNLSFGVAMLPQVEGNTIPATFGEMTGLAIARGSKNPQGALAVAVALAGMNAQTALLSQTGMPTVRRDISVDTSSNAAGQIFVQSALIAKAWLDPNADVTDDIFKGMVESVLSGKNSPASAVGEAAQALYQLTKPTNGTQQNLQ